MKPIYITVGSKRPLIVIPDSQAHVDGHPVLTYTYSIYRRNNDQTQIINDTDSLLAMQRKDNPDYLGFITFEQPGKVFSYTADGDEELNMDVVEELIEQISHYRATPQMWAI